jgi:uncharacterized zinc-type alcohol dehydrogenase-like protein
MSTATELHDETTLATHQANFPAWVAKAPNGPLALETVELGPLAEEGVEIAVEQCGLCHTDLSILNND